LRPLLLRRGFRAATMPRSSRITSAGRQAGGTAGRASRDLDRLLACFCMHMRLLLLCLHARPNAAQRRTWEGRAGGGILCPAALHEVAPARRQLSQGIALPVGAAWQGRTQLLGGVRQAQHEGVVVEA
jgi:hypothetical protein